MEDDQDYGLNFTESLASYDHGTSSWRTLQTCLFGGLAEFSETWPRAGMMRNGTVYLRITLAPRRPEIEYFLWPTLPASPESGGARFFDGGSGARAELDRLIGVEERKRINSGMNPIFAEWLMGFPMRWTELANVGMQLFPKSQNG